MVKTRQGLKIANFLSRIFRGTSRNKPQRKDRRADFAGRIPAEQLESRLLLTLAGVDFGGGLTPTNWAAFSETTDTTLTNLLDESGAATGIDLEVDFDDLPGAYAGFAPAAGDLPIHSQSLAGIDENYADQGSVRLTFQNLVAGQSYEVYVFAGDTFSDTQEVRITDAAAGTTLTTFAQPHISNQLVINDQVADSSRALGSYAIGAPADANGEITITVDSGSGTFFGLAGVALGIPAPPVGLYLNEIVADLPSGTDNPNEYVELRGAAGQSLNDVYLLFVDSNDQPSQGEIRSGTSGLIDLAGSAIGPNGFLAVVDDAADPYAINAAAGVFNVPGLDIDDASYTALLVYVDPLNGTAPVAGQDLDAGNDGLDALPTGWTVLDGMSVLDGAIGSRGYAPIGISPTADGLLEAGATLVTTGFGASTNQVMRVGNSTGSTPADWVAFELADTPPVLTVAQTTNAAYQVTSIITNHLGATNPTAATPPPAGVTISIVEAFISENGGLATATVTRNTDTTNPLTVTLTSDDTGEATVVASVDIAAGETTSLPFDITGVDDLIIDGTQVVTITASAGGHQDGTDTIQILDDEAALTVNIADPVILENAGVGATTATVTRNTPTTESLLVTLLSDDTSEAVVIGTVTIPAGAATSASFNIDAIDDALIDGTQTVTLTASAFGHTDAVAGLNVDDDESQLTVAITAASVLESAGTNATTARVTRNTDTTSALTVTLMSDDTTEATVLGTVTIAAGQTTSPAFGITAVDDAIADGTQTVTIRATAVGHQTGTDTLDVLDDETPQLTVNLANFEFSEGDGPGATTGTITRNTDPTAALTVTLTSDDTSEATVIGSVVIPAGAATSLPFDIDAVDDALLDGTQTVTITATAVTGVGSVTGSATFDVRDDELGIWVAEGPFSATNGQIENTTPNRQIVGAIHTVIAHPTDPDIVYIGSVNGGVWRTFNATDTQPDWEPMTDDMPSQSISALTWDLGDSANQTIYAGTGRQSSFGRIGNERVGLLKTTDGGNTWQVMDGGGILRGANISGIAANGDNVVVSVNTADSGSAAARGIFRSTDGGVTFTQVSVGTGGATGLPNGIAFDLIQDPIDPDILYTNITQSSNTSDRGIYKTVDGGANWLKVSSPAVDAFVGSNFVSNLEMAVGRQNNVYIAVIETGNATAIFRSGDGGLTWVEMDLPVTFENTGNVGLNPRGSKGPTAGEDPSPEELAGGQGNIHFAIIADPVNPNIVYVGGDRQPRSNQDTGSFPNSIGARDFSGRLFRGDATQASGSQWVHLTHRNDLGAAGGGTANSTAPHADSREMAFDANGDLLETDDGGIYRRTSPQNNTGDWFAMTGSLQVTEAHDVAYDNLSNTFITGNQDTGTTYQPGENESLWISLSTADGGDVMVDTVSRAASNQSVRYSSFQNLGAFRQTVWDSSGQLVSTSFPALTIAGSSNRFNDGVFRTPTELNVIDPTRFLIQGNTAVWETLDQGTTVTNLQAADNFGISQNALAYGGRQNGIDNPDVIWAGSASDVYVRTTAGGNLAPTATDPTNRLVRDLKIDPDDWSSAYVVTDSEVIATNDTGVSWTDITGDLFSASGASSIYSLAYVADAVVDAVVVGTNLGVYSSFVGMLGTWTKLGSGFPNVLAYDMEYDATDDVLTVGTMGRGAWSLTDPFGLATAPDITIDDVTVNEGAGVASFNVSIAMPAVAPITLLLQTNDVTAVAGQDYTPVTGQVTIPAGATSSLTPFSVPILNDFVPELLETFTVSVQSVLTGSVGSTRDIGTGTILDNEATITVSIAAASVFEGDGAAATTATITRNTPTDLPLDVTLLSDDTTEATVIASVTIPAGAASVTVDIDAVADAIVDGTQTVTITPAAAGHIAISDTVDVLDSDVPSLSVSIAADAISEGDGPAATTATVSRNTDPTNALIVLLTSSDTAEATVIGSVLIPAGQTTSAPFDIDAIDEPVIDGTKVVTITATAPGFADGTDTVDVLDDETPLVSLIISDTSIAENGGMADVTAVLSFASTVDIVVDLSVTGTATGGGVDYNGPAAQLTIPAGQLTSAVTTITAIDDGTDEVDETVIVEIAAVSNALVDTNFQNVTTTIIDGNPQPTVSLVSANPSEVEGDDITYTLSLSAISSRDVTIDLAIGGTATGGGVDYTAPPLQVVIPAGQTSVTVTVPTIDDNLDEATETVILGMTGVVNGIAGIPSQVAVQILDGDAPPTVRLSVDQSAIPEDFGRAVFTARMSEVSGQDVTVNLQLLGTATPGSDYTISRTQLVIPAGRLTATTTLSALQDDLDEFDETALLQISSAINAGLIGTPQAQTTILDADIEPTVTLSSSVSSIAEDGGGFQFFATLNAVSGKDVTVNLLLRGDAEEGLLNDYTATPASPVSVVIPAGSTSVPVNITVNDDAVDEFDELVVIEFVSVVNAVENIVQQSSTTIIDNDAPAPVNLSASPLVLNHEGNGLTSTVTATLSTVSGKDVRVDLGLGGNATRNADYAIDTTTLLIPAGSLSASATISVIDDNLNEFDEVIDVSIVNAVNADASGAQTLSITIIDDESLPTVSLAVDSPTIVENGGTAVFTATLSEVSGRDVTVDLLISGLAMRGTDYSDPGTQIVIPAGSLSAAVSVTAVSDLLDEFDETIVVDIDAVDFATPTNVNQAVTTILDDDPSPIVDITANAVSVSEADVSFTFNFTLSEVSGRDITIDLGVTGTAMAGLDYVSPGSQIVIPAGQLSVSLPIALLDDAADEFDETVIIDLLSVDFATSGTSAQATTTILDDDPEPTVSLSLADPTIAEAGGSTDLTIALSAPSGKDVTVNLDLLGIALAGVDYVDFGSSQTIPAGVGSIVVPVTAIDDDLDEPNELVFLSVQSIVNGVWDNATVSTTIVDDDVPTLTLVIAPDLVNEADGVGAATATLIRNTSLAAQLQVTLSSSDPGEANVRSSALFPVGQAAITVPIDVFNDFVLDGTQTATITVSSPGYIDGVDTIDVTDATVEVNLEVSTAAASETDQTVVTVTARTLNPAVGDQTLDLTVGGAGITSGDYLLSGTTITIPDGQTTGTVTFTVVDDPIVESLTETVTIGMTNLTAGLAAGATPDQDIAITDNDAASISIDDVTLAEGDAGTTTFIFTATLDVAVDTAVTVDYLAADGTATTADDDYTAAGGTLNFAGMAGETQTLAITVTGDEKVELDENFLVNLSNIVAGGRNVTFVDAQGVGSISNDDSATITINDVTLGEGDAGDTSFVFSVTLDAEIGGGVSLTYDVNQDTATAGVDFTQVLTGSLNFAANSGGPQTLTLEVLVTGDQTVELDETFSVDLSSLNASGLDVTVADSQGLGTITNDDAAALSVSDVTQDEGDAGSSLFVFTVTLDADVDVPLTVDYGTADVNATTLDGDYLENTGSGLSFAGTAGETRTISVTVNSDQKVELDEVFELALSNLAAAGRNVSIAGPGLGTITNDDSATISIDSVSLNEGDLGATALVFTVTLDGTVDTILNADFATASDTASDADGDYVSAAGTVTFAPNLPGPQTRTLSVLVTGDRKVELDETFLVDLSNIQVGGRNVTFASSQGTGTINNDDSATLSINDVAVNEGDTGDTFLTFTVTLDAETDTDILVDFDTSDGTALNSDSDYLGNTGNSLTFAANAGGSQVQTFTVTVQGDEKVELDETFLVNLSALAASGRAVTITDAQGVGTIQNDDSATLSIDNVTLDEGNSGDTLFTFTVTLDGEVDTNVAVSYNTAASTASPADGDYVSSGVNSLNFPSGNGNLQTRTLSVTVAGDQKVEVDEAFFVNLFNPNAAARNVIISDAQGLGTITNDDSATVSVNDISASEGATGDTVFTFTVTLDAEVDVPVSFEWSTIDDSAMVADNDYTAVNAANAGFAANNGAGSQTQTISVAVTGDTKVEQDESFLVALSSLTAAGRNVTLDVAQARATILNDDSATISIDDITQNEGDSGNSVFTFTVTLSNEIDADVSVNYDTAEGTATLLDSDFTANTGNSLTFSANAGPGPQTQTLAVQVQGDGTVELDESFFVNLSGLLDAGRLVTIADDQGIGTIANDESAAISINDVTLTEGNAGSQQYVFTVTLDTAVDTGISLNAATADGTAATADNDYAPADQTLIFNGTAGETRTIGVTVNGDQTVELDENFIVNLTALATNGRDVTITVPQGTGGIRNDDTASLSINDVSLTEQNSGTTNLTFSITLSGAVDTPITVDFNTADGSATVSGNDYQSRSGSVTFNGLANEIRTISVPVVGDINVEPDETFLVNLSNLVTAGRSLTVADSQGVGTILGDDSVFVSIANATVSEGSVPNSSFLNFTVTRDNTTIPIDIDFSTLDGIATVADGDYRPRTGTLRFPVSTPNTATIVVEVIGDNQTETTENLFVNISSSSFGVVITDSQGEGTIFQDDGAIVGQKWHDLDADGMKDAGEPGLDGFVIQIIDSEGRIVGSAVTASMDLNNDGIIDPVTEQGLYEIPANAGDWTVAEVLPDGWRQTHPNGGDALAYQLDQQYNLRFTGNYFEDWGGLGEKWLFGTGGWYFITPDGTLFRWNGSPKSNLSGEPLGAPGPKFHAAPSLLYNAQPPGGRTITVVSGQTTTGVDFGNVPTGSIEGRKFHDVDADGRHDNSEPWLNGWTITLRNDAGEIVGQTVTSDIDRNGDGVIDPRSERGVYQFRGLVPGDYTVSEETRPLWTQGGADGLFSAEAYSLNQERDFGEPRKDFENWGGRGEKWLWSNVGWHFVTPDGSIYEWNNSPQSALTGRLVTQFNSDYWQDLSLIYNAPRPNQYLVTITGQEATGLDYGNTFAHDGTGVGNVIVTANGPDVTVTGDNLANSVVLYVSVDGSVTAQGVDRTLVNGSSGPVSILPGRNLNNLSISLNGGNDQLVLTDLFVNTATVQTGDGNDLVATTGLDSSGAVTVNNSSGLDETRIHSSTLTNLNVSSSGLTSIQDAVINGALAINSGASASTLFVQGTTVTGVVSMLSGAAADSIIANRSSFGSNVTVDAGNGNDLMALRASQIAGSLIASGRAGNDIFGLSVGSTVAGGATLRGGSGTDTAASDGTTAAATLSGVENTIDSDLEDLIDLALGNFDDLMLDL